MRRPHAAEAWEAEQAAQATRFTAILRISPLRVYKSEHETRAEAEAAAKVMDAVPGAHGRRASVYGITQEGRTIFLQRG